MRWLLSMRLSVGPKGELLTILNRTSPAILMKLQIMQMEERTALIWVTNQGLRQLMYRRLTCTRK